MPIAKHQERAHKRQRKGGSTEICVHRAAGYSPPQKTNHLLPVRKLTERNVDRPDVVVAEGVFFPALEAKNRRRIGHVKLEGLVVSGMPGNPERDTP